MLHGLPFFCGNTGFQLSQADMKDYKYGLCGNPCLAWPVLEVTSFLNTQRLILGSRMYGLVKQVFFLSEAHSRE